MATNFLMPLQPSLASATNTRVDSSKLHFQCRVSTDDMLSFTEVLNDVDDVKRHKYRYCIHKDEIVLCVGRPWDVTLSRKRMNQAYPRVISNLGAMDHNSRRGRLFHKVIAFMNHFARTVQEKHAIVEALKNTTLPQAFTYREFPTGRTTRYQEDPFFTDEEQEEIKNSVLPYMHDFVPMGYAATLGWAHPDTGDTMVTAMIGGIRTVMNGDFEVFTGDLIQWYWDFELQCFKADGKRKEYLNFWENRNVNGVWRCHPGNASPFFEVGNGVTNFSLPQRDEKRKNYHEKVFGQKPRSPKVVPRIKPFIRDDQNPRMYDHMRVFAVAVTSARPHEMVDIKIARQSC